MSTLNLNANINGAKRGLPYPTAGLDVIVYNSTYEDGGTTYYRTSKGIGLPVISGTGLDTIIDFAPLNDVRFDKSNTTYWGASLNAWFYYDALNPYHAKLKDFHYRYFENQMASESNTIFARFIYSGEDLISVDRILVYSAIQPTISVNKLLYYIYYRDNGYYLNEVITSLADGQYLEDGFILGDN